MAGVFCWRQALLACLGRVAIARMKPAKTRVGGVESAGCLSRTVCECVGWRLHASLSEPRRTQYPSQTYALLPDKCFMDERFKINV